MYAAFYLQKIPYKSLSVAEMYKKRKYLESCIWKRRHFSPLFISFNGLLVTEVEYMMKRLSSLLATNWRQTYYQTYGYVRIRVSITMVRAIRRCIQGSQVPASRIIVHKPQWEDGSILYLYH